MNESLSVSYFLLVCKGVENIVIRSVDSHGSVADSNQGESKDGFSNFLV